MPGVRGRPPAALAGAKTAAILEAGARTFLDRGFEAASMDAIARRAGVSKATIYSHFDSKVALLGAIVEDRCSRMMPAHDLAELETRPLAEVLAAVGREFLDLLRMPDSIPLYRLVLTAAARFPGLGRVFHAAGPERVTAQLAEFLKGAAARGALAIADPRLAADHFFGLVVGCLDLKLMLGIVKQVTDAERDRLVDAAVGAFLRAYARGRTR